LDYYKNVTELKLAKSYFNLNEKSRADSILQNLVDNPDIDENIKMAALSDIAFINVVKSEKNLIRATELYEDIMYNGDKSFLTYKDYWAYSFALSNIGRREESQDLVTQLLQVDSSATAYYWQYLMESSKGNHYEALTLLENFVTSNNIEVNEVLKQSLSLIL
jgi:tetratricopeptide (TPR) repeat protein